MQTQYSCAKTKLSRPSLWYGRPPHATQLYVGGWLGGRRAKGGEKVRGWESGIGGRRGGPQPKGCARPMPGAAHAPTGPAGEQAPPPTGCQHRRPVMSRRASGPTVTAPTPSVCGQQRRGQRGMLRCMAGARAKRGGLQAQSSHVDSAGTLGPRDGHGKALCRGAWPQTHGLQANARTLPAAGPGDFETVNIRPRGGAHGRHPPAKHGLQAKRTLFDRLGTLRFRDG